MFFFLVGGTAMKSGRLGTEGAMRPAFLELLNGKRLHWDNASLFWFCLCSHVFALLSCDDKQDNTPLPEIQRGLSAAPQKEQRRPRSCAVPEFGADAGAAMGQTSREESLLWVPCCRRAQTGKSHNRREHKSKFSWGFFKHNFFFKPVFTFIPENMRAWVYENRERERDRDRESERGDVLPGGEGLLHPIHSGHHVSSERGKEASFSSQQRKSKDQITRCCSRNLALCRGRGCDHPDKDGTAHTGFIWKLGCLLQSYQ